MGSTLNKIRYFVVKLDVLIENFLDSMIRITKNTKILKAISQLHMLRAKYLLSNVYH